MDNIILTYLPLLIAFLAVFMGPLISYIIMKRQINNSQSVANAQIDNSLKIANKQIVAPMRQRWINNLRELIAEFQSTTLHYFVTGFEDRTDEEYHRIGYLEEKIKLILNPIEDDHQELINLVRQSISALSSINSEDESVFIDNHPKVTELSQNILKREWNRVKEKL